MFIDYLTLWRIKSFPMLTERRQAFTPEQQRISESFRQMSIHDYFNEMLQMCHDNQRMEDQMIERAERIRERFDKKG
jgi:hypothetical protein